MFYGDSVRRGGGEYLPRCDRPFLMIDTGTHGTQKRQRLLLQDVRCVDRGKQVPAFHLNTKLAHLIIEGCLDAEGWAESCEKFVSCLPPTGAVCGWRGVEVDPFRGARQAFPSNRTGERSELPSRVMDMWERARANTETAHTSLQHGNLLEILEMSGLTESGESTKFYREVLGLKRTPAEELEELLTECQGEDILGTGKLLRLEGGGFSYLGVGGTALWEDDDGKTYLSMEGCGCICRWRVLHGGGNVVVIQEAGAIHTSVTNMAEKVRDACRLRYGGEAKCHEFYEPVPGRPASMPCEITGGDGEGAGWIPVPVDSLPLLEEWIRSRGS
jgi:hypothetical protein